MRPTRAHSEAYPLEHWSSRIQPLSANVTEAVDRALQIDDRDPEQDLGGNAKLIALSGAGNHTVFRLHVDDRAYCLKRLRGTERPLANIERVLRGEAGGMCTLARLAPGRAPRPVCLEPVRGLDSLRASAWECPRKCRTDATATAGASPGDAGRVRQHPESIDEPLWDIDWNIAFLLEWLRDSYAELVEKAANDNACAEAAAIMGDCNFPYIWSFELRRNRNEMTQP